MEASKQQNETTAQPQGESKRRERKRAHVEYVALIENGAEPGVNGWELVVHGPDADERQRGKPVIWHAYRAPDVIGDVIEAGLVTPDDAGRTPFIVAVPARSWRPQRATVATARRIRLEGGADG